MYQQLLKAEEGIMILEVCMTEMEMYLITKFWLITLRILGLTKTQKRIILNDCHFPTGGVISNVYQSSVRKFT